MLHTAAVLFVRNDIETLGWWLAQHATLGFSTLIVCDDHSTDGTAALLESAAAFHDIRVYTSDATLASPAERRKTFEHTLVKEAEGEFDWLLFLAVDEFLHLEHTSSVDEFLEEHADNPVLHWCIFGSNGHQTDTPFAPTERFTRHAAPGFSDHHITRRFVEPNSKKPLPDPFHSPHIAPNWEHARILHFACGDRGSFDRRMGADTHTDTDNAAWDHFNQNEHEWHGAKPQLARTRTLHAAIDQARLAELHCQLTKAIAHDSLALANRLGVSLLQNAPSPPPTQHFAIGRTVRLILNTTTNELQGIPETLIEHDRHIPLILSIERPCPTSGIAAALLTTQRPNNRAFLAIEGVASLLAYIPLHIDTRQRCILSPVTQTPITFPLADQSLTKVQPPAEYAQRLTAYRDLTAHGHNLTALIHGIAQQEIIDASALGCAIALLPADDAHRLSSQFPGLVPASIRPLSLKGSTS